MLAVSDAVELAGSSPRAESASVSSSYERELVSAPSRQLTMVFTSTSVHVSGGRRLDGSGAGSVPLEGDFGGDLGDEALGDDLGDNFGGGDAGERGDSSRSGDFGDST
jgi:hypothetical protein